MSAPENNLIMTMTANIIIMPFSKELMYKCIYKGSNSH